MIFLFLFFLGASFSACVRMAQGIKMRGSLKHHDLPEAVMRSASLQCLLWNKIRISPPCHVDTSAKNRFSFRSRAQMLLSNCHDVVVKFLFKTGCEDICGLQTIKVRHIAFPRLLGASMADLENLLWAVKEQFAHTLLALLSLFCWWEFRQVCDKICPDFTEMSHIHKSQDWAEGVVVPYVSLKTFVS